MRGVLHLAGTLLLVPYFVLAAFFVLVGRAAASGSWWNLIDLLANTAYWTLYVGLPLVALIFLTLATAGFFASAQRLATLVLAGLSGIVLVILIFWPTTWPDFGQWLFLLPCVLVFALSLLTALSER